MNWIFYIFGGILFIKTIPPLVNFIENDFKIELNFPSWVKVNYICIIMLWIWICLTYIK